MRRQDRVAPVQAVHDRRPELPRVLAIPGRVEHRTPLGIEHVAPLVDHAPVRVERPSLVVDLVPERIERAPEADVDLPVHGQERRDELGDARGTAGLVVVDDVPALALVPEIVVDEGLGLEHDLIADRGRDDEDARMGSARLEVEDVGLEPAAEQAELQLLLDGARARARPAREEEVPEPVGQGRHAVVLQRPLVEPLVLEPVHLVRAELLQEEPEQRVREQVLARAVDEPWKAHALQHVPHHQRVHVRRMGGGTHERARLGEAR